MPRLPGKKAPVQMDLAVAGQYVKVEGGAAELPGDIQQDSRSGFSGRRDRKGCDELHKGTV